MTDARGRTQKPPRITGNSPRSSGTPSRAAHAARRRRGARGRPAVRAQARKIGRGRAFAPGLRPRAREKGTIPARTDARAFRAARGTLPPPRREIPPKSRPARKELDAARFREDNLSHSAVSPGGGPPSRSNQRGMPMIVKELKEALANLDDEMEIVILDSEGELVGSIEVGTTDLEIEDADTGESTEETVVYIAPAEIEDDEEDEVLQSLKRDFDKKAGL